MRKERRPNIGIVTFPVGESGLIPLGHLVDIVSPLTGNLYLISGNAASTLFKHDHRVYFKDVEHNSGSNIVTRILRYAFTQLRICYKVAQISRQVDIFIFFIGGPPLLLPMLFSKLIRKKTVMALAGSATQSIEAESSVLSLPMGLMTKATFELSDRIIFYAERLVEEYGLQKYSNKISIAQEHFVDLGIFKIQKPLNDRENFIGYIGRFSQEKGILNLIETISQVLEVRDDVKFLIGGRGKLRGQIEDYLRREKLETKVKLVDWIPHHELPNYLNELKLLVLPSYTEGLPNIMLEAMACGTPVLATPVGAIPDVIKDGEAGFIMEDNSPECLAKNIIRVLNYPHIEEVAQNAHALVGKEFIYEKAVEKYKRILSSSC